VPGLQAAREALALAREGNWDGQRVPASAEREFRHYLEYGILACGFCRARCPTCGQDFLVAFSCKGRAVCPSCNARRMAETAAHLVDHVFPPLPVRKWVLSVPKRLRYFLEREPAAAGQCRAAHPPTRGPVHICASV
jgi:hypothetical protein